MAENLIEKLLSETVRTGGTYAEFIVFQDKISFISDGGTRKSTRNYRQTKKEIKESEKQLKSINERNLLFSGTLKRLEVTFSNGRNAVFQRSDGEAFITITARKATETKEKRFEFICFMSEGCSYTGIAFAVTNDKKGKKCIIPCSGGIMNGVVDTAVHTDLQFVISGDFRVKETEFDTQHVSENQIVMEEVSALMKNALKSMIRLGLLRTSLFSVLPSTLDEDSFINIKLIAAIKEVCCSYPILRNRIGTLVSTTKLVFGTEEVTTLFPQKIAEPFINGKYWLEPCTPGSREEYFFLNDLNIYLYDRERFLQQIFTEDNLDECSEILANQDDGWLREFYIFCSNPLSEDITKRHVISGLKNIRSIRNTKGNMCYPSEIFFASDTGVSGKKGYFIKPVIISPKGKDDVFSDQLRAFFCNDLGIKEYSQRNEIKELATTLMSKKQKVDKKYVEKLLLFAKYEKEHPNEIGFNEYALFPYESTRGIRRVKADELVIGKPYIREGALLASATERVPIWQGFKDLLNKEDLEMIIAFAEKCGAIGLPVIVKQKAEEHSAFLEKLFSTGKQGARDSNYDFTIPGLEEILRRRSLQLNKLVWAAIVANDNHENVLSAEYSVDNRKTVNRCDSSLVMILKSRTWVPGKDGKLYMPENITPSDIHESLIYDKRNPILKALQFGAGIKKKEKMIQEMKRMAAREGLRVIPEEEYQEFLIWKQSMAEK